MIGMMRRLIQVSLFTAEIRLTGVRAGPVSHRCFDRAFLVRICNIRNRVVSEDSRWQVPLLVLTPLRWCLSYHRMLRPTSSIVTSTDLRPSSSRRCHNFESKISLRSKRWWEVGSRDTGSSRKRRKPISPESRSLTPWSTTFLKPGWSQTYSSKYSGKMNSWRTCTCIRLKINTSIRRDQA